MSCIDQSMDQKSTDLSIFNLLVVYVDLEIGFIFIDRIGLQSYRSLVSLTSSASVGSSTFSAAWSLLPEKYFSITSISA